MSGIPRTRRPPAGPTGRAGHGRLPLQPGDLDPWTGGSTGPDMCAVTDPLSFWRIAPIPFAAWVAALEHWQLTGPDGELRLDHGVLRGPSRRALLDCLTRAMPPRRRRHTRKDAHRCAIIRQSPTW